MTEADLIGPSSNFYISQRLRLHYVDWGNEDAPLLLLIHGGRDHARSWDWVARELRRDYHVVAPDLRGHGDSAWSIGGNYGLMDFVLDITRLVEALGVPQLRVIGHSLGGNVALHYAGLFPERVSHLVAAEGLGPIAKLPEDAERPAPSQQVEQRHHGTTGGAASDGSGGFSDGHEMAPVRRVGCASENVALA
mgnify:CR=1 FL=1